MLKVTIFPVYGDYSVSQDYEEELLDVSVLMSNTDSTPFSASMPKMTATVTLAVYDNFLASIKRGAEVRVYDAGGAPASERLTLRLKVIEVTGLKYTNQTEISCTGAFFDETNDIWGTLLIENDTWASTKSKYSLDNVVHFEDNGKFYAHVNSKSDLVMALAWSYATRRTVSLMPFTTANNEDYSGTGVGIFKEARATQETGPFDTHAPVYKIIQDQIVDYNISPAQPPVTHLVPVTLGDIGPVPTVPEVIARSDIAEYNAYNTARFYYIEELQLGAMLVIHMKEDPNDPEGSDVFDKAVIYWSDGIETVLDWATGPFNIGLIGITPTAYVISTPAGTQYKVYDRITNQQLGPTYAHPSGVSAYYLRNTAFIREHYIETASGVFTTYLFYDIPVSVQSGTAGYRAYIGLALTTVNEQTSAVALMTPAISRTANWDYVQFGFGGTCKVNSTTSNRVVVSYLLQAMTGPDETPYHYAYQVCMESAGVTCIELGEMPYYVRAGIPTFALAQDFVATDNVPTASRPAYLIGSHRYYEAGGLWRQYIYVWVFKGAGQRSSTIIASASSRNIMQKPTVQFVYDKDKIIEGLKDFYYLYYENERNGNWTLASLVVQGSGYGHSDIQTGNTLDWAFKDADSQGLVYLSHGAAAIINGIPDSGPTGGVAEYSVKFQLGPVPMLLRSNVRDMTPQMISAGSRNEMRMPYRCGMLSQSDMSTVDTDFGRIEIEIARFYVRDNTTWMFYEKDVQLLNIIAIGSYVKVQLDEEQTVEIKVTSYTINYSGVVTAKVAGIIVKEL